MAELKEVTVKLAAPDLRFMSGYPKPKYTAYPEGATVVMLVKIKNVGNAISTAGVIYFEEVINGRKLYGVGSVNYTLKPGENTVEYEVPLTDSPMPKYDLTLEAKVASAQEPRPPWW